MKLENHLRNPSALKMRKRRRHATQQEVVLSVACQPGEWKQRHPKGSVRQQDQNIVAWTEDVPQAPQKAPSPWRGWKVADLGASQSPRALTHTGSVELKSSLFGGLSVHAHMGTTECRQSGLLG